MNRFLKWAGIAAAVLVSILVLAVVTVYAISNSRFGQTLAVDESHDALSLEGADLEEGARKAIVMGCADCHGEDLTGKVMLDDPAVGTLAAPNLTPAGPTAEYTPTQMAWTIRHGVRPSGKPLLVMPVEEFYQMGEDDLRDIVAYIMSLPPKESELPVKRIGPLGRILYVTGAMPMIPAETMEHDQPHPEAPDPGATREYGAYLAVGCTGCHGPTLSGGKMPSAPPGFPEVANITPDEATGIGTWTEEDFTRLLRQGVRPDGSEVRQEYMPVQVTRHFNDDEVHALWLYLSSVEAKPYGNR